MLAFEQLLLPLRCEKVLLEGDLNGMTPLEIRRLAMTAWNDRKRADEFASEVYRQRLERKIDD